ncbi:MAG TPA: hypothetical protein VIV60_02645 [Polyangiaceae bacterium]
MRVPGILGLFAAVASLAVVTSACTTEAGALLGNEPGGNAGSSGTGLSSGGSVHGGSGGALTIVMPTSGSGSGASKGGSTDGEVVACTDGEDCVCPTLSVAVVGKPGVWGDSSDTAFQNWLNSSSAGTAKVDNYLTKPVFTPDFLAGYNVIVLASLGDTSANGPWWTFSASEMAAFQDWIENSSGGVISLSGYSADNGEIKAKNALLAFSGISYHEENISPSCIIENATHDKMCYQCGNPYQISEWNRNDLVVANLSLGVTMIGIDGGHPITAPADAHVAAMTTTSTIVNDWLVGKVVGKGRVLVYADEWITYTNQWSGEGGQNSNDTSCSGLLPQQLYQTSQFWYNMIRWVQPTSNCFKIVDKQQPIILW